MSTDFLCGSKANSLLGEPCNEKGGVRPMLCVVFTWVSALGVLFSLLFPAPLRCSGHLAIPTELNSIYKGAIGPFDYIL